jgi:SAM-dependent methyltransferase
MNYQEINSKAIDSWCDEGWEWGQPIDHDTFVKAKNGEWDVLLTPTKSVPHDWFLPFGDCKILGLASGGGQQMPIFAALGADVTVLDYSDRQLESERLVSKREGYNIRIVKSDMTNPLPFKDGEFDLIFSPVSFVYVEKIEPIFKECHRILRDGGVLLCGLDNGINFITNNEDRIENKFPFNPLVNPEQYESLMNDDCGVQFSHSMEENIGGQLKAGFRLLDIYDDTNGSGRLHELNIPTFFATRAVK